VKCRYPIAGEVVDSYRLRHGPDGPAGLRVTRSDLAAARRRQLNPRRARWQKPGAVVRALGLRRGQVVAEIGAGLGYMTELLARTVGPSGVVYGQNTPGILQRFAEKPWSERLQKPVMKNVVRADREFDDPLPKEAHDLDAHGIRARLDASS